MSTRGVSIDHVRVLLRARALRGRGGKVEPLTQYQTDPVGFAVDVLGVAEESLRWSRCPGYEGHRWDGDVDPIAAMLEALAEGEDAGNESGTGTGKTFAGGIAVLWFLACFPDALVVTTAPREKQLRLNLWKEVGRFWPRFQRRFPGATLTDLRIRMGSGDEWSAHGMGSGVRAGEESATRMQGFHAASMLVVMEEMPGMDAAIVRAIEQTVTGDHNLRLGLGNPDSQSDPLHRFSSQPGVRAIRTSALDHPNVVLGREVVPGAVGRKSVARRREEHGEESRVFRSRVRGISPEQPADALIRGEWIDAAVARWRDPEARRVLMIGEPSLGVDVANSEDGDSGAISRWQGAVLEEVESFPCPDALQLGRRVAKEIRRDGIPPSNVGVDVVGVGGATWSGMAEEGLRTRGLNSGAGPQTTVDWEARVETGEAFQEPETFRNLRAQMWWYFRRDLQRGYIALPPDPVLREELLEVRWWEEPQTGKITMEPKDDISARLGRSPDKADAAVYGNWVRPRRRKAEEEVEEVVPDRDTGFDDLVKRNAERKLRKRGF